MSYMHKNVSWEHTEKINTKYRKGKRTLEEGKRKDCFLGFISFSFSNEQFLLILMTQEHKDGGRRGDLI